jgi:hypothetical protein
VNLPRDDNFGQKADSNYLREKFKCVINKLCALIFWWFVFARALNAARQSMCRLKGDDHHYKATAAQLRRSDIFVAQRQLKIPSPVGAASVSSIPSHSGLNFQALPL